MKIRPEDKINAETWIAFLEEEKLVLLRRERRVERVQRFLTYIWVLCVVVGWIFVLTSLKCVGLVLMLIAMFLILLCAFCSTYLVGKAEGRLENAISQLIIAEKLMKEKK